MTQQVAPVEQQAVRADQAVLEALNVDRRHIQDWLWRSNIENDTHYQLAAPHHPLLKPETPLIGAINTTRTPQRPAINPWMD